MFSSTLSSHHSDFGFQEDFFTTNPPANQIQPGPSGAIVPFWYESCIANLLEEASYGRHKRKELEMRMLMHVRIPHEPFNADVEFHIVMTPDDLRKSGLETLGKKWK
jgi:hypothetical protein